ncbi:MAG: T9SS type A sorting domain-containing protein, partial [Fibrobacteria bacterium]|nr:T9SS type A sorting domain-containing protein [Fibrobacteria bacterium]
SPAGSFPYNEWHHFAFTWDGTTASIYIDGKKQAAAAWDADFKLFKTRPLRLGKIVSRWLFFKGMMDEFQLIGRPLTSFEILNDFHSGNYRYSSDNGTTWGDWMTGSVTGGDRSVNGTITVADLPLKQQEDGKNLIEFAARDMNGNVGTRQLVIQSNDVVSAENVITYKLEDVRFSPNPFYNTTSLTFQLPSGGNLELDIYGIDGKLVHSLRSGFLSAGRHSLAWDGKDQQGNDLTTGQYFARVKTGKTEMVKRLMILR